MKTAPVFAVIGRVNKGKSSIVSTLAEDDSVRIERAAGTTRNCQEFPIQIDGRVVMTLIDTPGFQQAPRALAWLKSHEVSAANRREVVEKFVAHFSGGKDFVDECRLLQPILQGAGILYVVDSAKPFRRNYESEMEILRWTGQPRMALINKIGSHDFSKEWQQALDQYFSVVRHFNAQHEGFAERIKLLQVFRELNDAWRAAVDESIEYLKNEWRHRQLISAQSIASMLVDELTYYREIALDPSKDLKIYRSEIETKFHNYLRKREEKSRNDIEKTYNHLRLNRESTELQKPLFDRDLFAQSTWDFLGLTPRQLLGVGAVGGATVGGALDAVVGGASFMTGAVAGALLGAGSVFYFSTNRFASLEYLGSYLRGQKLLRIGPHKNKNFPWVLLDRALLHYFSIRDWAHSRREVLHLESDAGYAKHLRAGQKAKLAKIFAKLSKRAGRNTQDLQVELQQIILTIIQSGND